MTHLAAALVALVLAVAPAFAATTARHGFNYTDHEGMNTTIDRMDQKLPLTSQGRPSFDIFFCGNAPNNTTQYFGAPDATNLMGFGGTACDAEDDTTEATADDVVWSAPLKVLGMCCRISSSGSNGVTLTLRSAAADLSPSLTMTIPTGATNGCAYPTSDTTLPTVAAGATMAVKIVSTENIATVDTGCIVTVEPAQ